MSDLPDIEWRGGSLVYPIPQGGHVDTFDRLDFHVRKWFRSDSYQHFMEVPEAGFYAMQLWFLAFEEVPVGTIPADPERVAFQLRLGRGSPAAKRFVRLFENASRGHVPVVMPDGAPIEGRVAHPVALAVCLDAWNRKQDHDQGKAARRQRQKRSRISRAWQSAHPGAARELNDAQLDMMALWMNHFGYAQSDSEGAKRAAVEVLRGWSPEGGAVPVPLSRRGRSMPA